MYRYVQPLWIGSPETGREDPAFAFALYGFFEATPSMGIVSSGPQSLESAVKIYKEFKTCTSGCIYEGEND